MFEFTLPVSLFDRDVKVIKSMHPDWFNDLHLFVKENSKLGLEEQIKLTDRLLAMQMTDIIRGRSHIYTGAVEYNGYLRTLIKELNLPDDNDYFDELCERFVDYHSEFNEYLNGVGFSKWRLYNVTVKAGIVEIEDYGDYRIIQWSISDDAKRFELHERLLLSDQ